MKRLIILLFILIPSMVFGAAPKVNNVATPAKVDGVTSAKVNGVAGATSSIPADVTFWWTMSETSTPWWGSKDYSAGDNTPTQVNSAAISGTGAKVGAGAMANTGAKYFSFDLSTALINPTKCTIGFWMKQDTAILENYVTFFDATKDANTFIKVVTGSTGKRINITTKDGTNAANCYGPSDIITADTDQWVQVQIDSDTNTITTTVNGAAYCTNSASAFNPITLDSGTLKIGVSNGLPVNTVRMDNVIISNLGNKDMWGGGSGLCVQDGQ